MTIKEYRCDSNPSVADCTVADRTLNSDLIGAKIDPRCGIYVTMGRDIKIKDAVIVYRGYSETDSHEYLISGDGFVIGRFQPMGIMTCTPKYYRIPMSLEPDALKRSGR